MLTRLIRSWTEGETYGRMRHDIADLSSLTPATLPAHEPARYDAATPCEEALPCDESSR
jgi:hypothetical protein